MIEVEEEMFHGKHFRLGHRLAMFHVKHLRHWDQKGEALRLFKAVPVLVNQFDKTDAAAAKHCIEQHTVARLFELFTQCVAADNATLQSFAYPIQNESEE